MKKIIPAVLAGLALVAGVIAIVISTHGTSHAAPVKHVTAAAKPAAAPAVKLTASQETQECAALAMVRSGIGSYSSQVQAVAGQYTLSQAQAEHIIATVIQNRCPSLVSVIPAGAPVS